MLATELHAQKDSGNAGQYASVNGLKMYYEVHGNGKPLVLIHGGGSTIGTTFGMVLPAFSKKYKVIAVELQAHGHTADRNRPLSFEQDADDVAELLKQLNIKGASIFGFSNGGNTAMQIAIRHPELVGRLVIASSMYKREGMYPWFWDAMKNAKLENMPRQLKDAYLSITNDTARLQVMHDRDVQRMLTFRDWNENDIRSIKVPALVVNGDADVVTTEHAVELYRLLPHGRLAIFPGGHGDYLGEITTIRPGNRLPDLFITVVEDFLDSPDNQNKKNGFSH